MGSAILFLNNAILFIPTAFFKFRPNFRKLHVMLGFNCSVNWFDFCLNEFEQTIMA